MHKSLPRRRFWLLLLLALAFSFNWSLQSRFSCRQTPNNKDGWVRKFVPERLRSFVAGYCWSRADTLMHRGPAVKSLQKFQAGSYAGNTDIVPLLRMVVEIMPEELAPYQLLARNLAYYLDRGDEALRILQQGIINNPTHPAVHELYAAAAFQLVFAGGRPPREKLQAALRYLQGAADHLTPAAEEFASDPSFKIENYQILAARLHLELGQPDLALKAWSGSGQNLDAANDQLAAGLRHYRDHGSLPPSGFPALAEIEPDQPEHDHEHDHELNCEECGHAAQMAAAPSRSLMMQIFGTGLLLLIALVLNYRLTRG